MGHSTSYNKRCQGAAESDLDGVQEQESETGRPGNTSTAGSFQTEHSASHYCHRACSIYYRYTINSPFFMNGLLISGPTLVLVIVSASTSKVPGRVTWRQFVRSISGAPFSILVDETPEKHGLGLLGILGATASGTYMLSAQALRGGDTLDGELLRLVSGTHFLLTVSFLLTLLALSLIIRLWGAGFSISTS